MLCKYVLMPDAAEYFVEHFCEAHTCNRKEQLARLETVAQVCLACRLGSVHCIHTCPYQAAILHVLEMHRHTCALFLCAVDKQCLRQQNLRRVHAHSVTRLSSVCSRYKHHGVILACES